MILTLLSLYNLFLRPYHSILFLHLFCFILLSLLLTIKKYGLYQILELCDSETHGEKGGSIKPLRTGFNPYSLIHDVKDFQVGFTFVLHFFLVLYSYCVYSASTPFCKSILSRRIESSIVKYVKGVIFCRF